MSRQMSEDSQGRGPLSILPSSPAIHPAPVSMRELPLGLLDSKPGHGYCQRTVTCLCSNNIIGSALGYGFLPADRVCTSIGLTFTNWLLVMQALLMPLRLKHMANNALVVSEGHSPVPAQVPWQAAGGATQRLWLWQVAHYWGQLPPPETDTSCSNS